MTKSKANALKNIAGVATLFVCFSALVVSCMMTPVVEMSHLTGKCVNVISNDASHSCDNLPKRYDRVWVR
jgi:hypothetical protein